MQAPSLPDPTPSPPTTTAGTLRPGLLLRLEGLALLAVSVALYAHLGYGWWLFSAVVLAPDLGLAGYLAGPRVGAVTYNVTHTSVLPVLLGGFGVTSRSDLAVAIALTWLAHIGADRAVGYGLKYPASFRETHLQRAA